MTDTQRITVAALAAMTADELRSKSIFRLSDPQNLTPEIMEKLRMRAHGLDEGHVLDLSLLDDRLRSVSRSDSASPIHSATTSGYSTPDINEAELVATQLRMEWKAYDQIIQDGGRPSHKPEEGSPNFSFLEQPAYQTAIIKYWRSRCYYRPTLLTQQKFCWNEFREYQDRERKRFEPQLFGKRVEYIQKYMADKGLAQDVQILADRHQQSGLADWVEYLFFQHRVFDDLKEELQLHEQEQARSDEQQTVDDRSRCETATMEQGSVMMAQSRRSDEEIDVELHSVLVHWITEQLTIIASESCSPEPGSDIKPVMSTSHTRIELGEQETTGDKPTAGEIPCPENSDREFHASNRNDPNGAAMSSSSPEKPRTPTPAEFEEEPANILSQENDEGEQHIMAIATETPLPEEGSFHDDSIASESVAFSYSGTGCEFGPATLWSILQSSSMASGA